MSKKPAKKTPAKDKQKTVLIPTQVDSKLTWIKEQLLAGHIVRFRFVLKEDDKTFEQIAGHYKTKEFIRADEKKMVWVFAHPRKIKPIFPESIRVEFHAISEDRHTTHLFAEVMAARWL